MLPVMPLMLPVNVTSSAVEPLTFMVFFFLLWKSMTTKILPIFLCVQQKKETHTGLG